MAASVDSGPGPEIVTVPAGPAVLSWLWLAVLKITPPTPFHHGPIRIHIRPQRVDVERNISRWGGTDGDGL